MFDKFGYSGIEFNISTNFVPGHLIALRDAGDDLVFDLCGEDEIPVGVVHSVEKGRPMWTIFQESSFSMVKLGADVPVLSRLKCVGGGLAGVAGHNEYSFGKAFAGRVEGQNVAVALQSDGGVDGGRYIDRVTILEEDDIFLRGLSAPKSMPRPPNGLAYDYIEFDFVAGIGSVVPRPTRATWTGSENYTHGKFVKNGTDSKSWYASHWAGTSPRILADLQSYADNFTRTFTVGMVDRGLDTFRWSIEFNPRRFRLSFRQRGTSGATVSNTPMLLAGMVTAVVVRE